MNTQTDYEKFVIDRICSLRDRKGVSAREMSLAIGQNPGYIHNIESGKALPSMNAFFYICDYFEISPKEFFDTNFKDPKSVSEIMQYIEKLDPTIYPHLLKILESITSK